MGCPDLFRRFSIVAIITVHIIQLASGVAGNENDFNRVAVLARFLIR